MIVLAGAAGCWPFKGYIIGSGCKPDSIRYATFTFVDVEPDYSIIENILVSRLELMGYRLTDEEPDFHISYVVFKGIPTFFGEPQKDRRWNKIISNDLNTSTMLIFFIESKTGTVFFQSYIKGIHVDPNFSNEAPLKAAVYLVCDQYRVFAEEASGMRPMER